MENCFGISIVPTNDEERLHALYDCEIDIGTEPFFNNLIEIMARCFDMPIALISLVDREQVIFKANTGLKNITQVSRGVSLCSLAILGHETLVFEDTLKEPCLLSNPFVAGDFGLRFYAGAPVTTPNGYNIGTVCVADKRPRSFSEMDRTLLARFAQSAMKAILQRKETLGKTMAS